MNWKTLASEYLFKDRWFTIRKDTCERPDGSVITPYYVYEFPDWVTAVALTRDGKIVMERQYRHALGMTMYELPGGCVDPSDPSLEAALARELKEETGYVFDRFDFLGKTSANPSTHNNWMHFYLAIGGRLEGKQELDEGEDIEVVLFTVDEVRQMLREHGFIQSMHTTALFYALEKLGHLRY
jgi:8-oxo-dGTP pyrophosphatase MutT (NUDIX family)